jgi:serine/threonine-protein kinase
MSPERWQQVKAAFHSALALSGAERGRFLARLDESDDLRAEVESLLAAYDADPGFIEQPAVGSSAWGALATQGAIGTATGPEPDAAGRRIGAYRLERRIGAGGMGAVYLATRADDEYRKMVAIKLIRADGPLSNPRRREEMLRRFRNERQTLANLEHPNIARLLDGGTTEAGAPYLVMEYIEGAPIDAYCDEHRLPTSERLQLFRKVCDAVRYAHQNLVVHRDLKPGNILVTPDGVPKLLDFGIAKLLDPDSSALAGDLTVTGTQPMTPSYASPEQLRGRPITTASDVYSLGVILYVLLTGRRPYELADLPLSELVRVVCETEPVRPSDAVTRVSIAPAPNAGATSHTPDPETISRTRDGRPDRLRRRLSGDVDNIVLKALRKEPERRYASAEQLADDIGRHLAGRPVAARKDTTAYRAAKFVRRHKVGVAAAVALIAVLVGGIATTTWQAHIANQKWREYEEIARFTTDLLLMGDPDEAEGKSDVRGLRLSMPEVLKRGEKQVADLAGQPAVQARLKSTLGRIYYNFGEYDQARRLLIEAMEFQTRALGGKHVDTLLTTANLGRVLRAQAELERAVELLERALAGLRRARGPTHRDTLEALSDLAWVRYEQHRFEDARALLIEGLDAARSTLGDADRLTALLMQDLGAVLHRQSQFAQAEPLLRSGHRTLAQVLGPDHPRTLIAMINLSNVLRDTGSLVEAEELLRDVLEIRQRVLPAEHPYIFATQRRLARVLWMQNDPDKLALADELGRAALAAERDKLGDDNIQTLYSINDLALILMSRGELDEAETLFREKLERGARHWGPEDEETLVATNNLADVLMRKDRLEEAEALFRDAVETATRVLGPDHYKTTNFRHNLGRCLTRLARYDEAEEQLQLCYRSRAATLPPDNPRVVQAIRSLAMLYDAWGREADAARYREMLAAAKAPER